MGLHYNRENSYFFVNGTEIIKFKSKIPEIILLRPLRLGNISKDWPVGSRKKKTELNGYVYNFRVDYDAIAVDDM